MMVEKHCRTAGNGIARQRLRNMAARISAERPSEMSQDYPSAFTPNRGAPVRAFAIPNAKDIAPTAQQ
jgi:hypothetical protein